MEHTLRRHSDHVPILLRCGAVDRTRTDRPFRFKIAWCAHEAYHKVVHDAWSVQGGDICQALKQVQEGSIRFNKEKFGNIFANKRKVEARLRGVQRALENVDSVHLVYLQ